MDPINYSLPRHSTKASKRSCANAVVDPRLSVIAEDGVLPAVPEKSRNNRTFSRGWAFNPPRHSFEESPPNYSFWDITGPKGEKLTDVRNNKYIARRGGWLRIGLIALVVLVLIVALAVGLGIGLHQKHPKSQPASASPTSAPSSVPVFPVGSYSLATYLETVSTNCTSNATTWTCAPYHTYDDSPSQSMLTFDWEISPSAPGSPTNLSISSSPNIFAIQFTNASLSLVDSNLQTERYQFRVPFEKIVIPSEAINVNCYYNATMLEGNMYTRLRQVFSDTSYTSTLSSASPASTGGSYSGGQQLWPYAVDITQTIGGGSDVPTCYRMQDGNKVEQLTQGLEAKASTDICSCSYKNNIT